VGDGEIRETYSNSASKNSPETDIFPHNLLLASVINDAVQLTLNNRILILVLMKNHVKEMNTTRLQAAAVLY